MPENVSPNSHTSWTCCACASVRPARYNTGLAVSSSGPMTLRTSWHNSWQLHGYFCFRSRLSEEEIELREEEDGQLWRLARGGRRAGEPWSIKEDERDWGLGIWWALAGSI